MRDKILCRGWAELKTAKVEESPFFWEGDFASSFPGSYFLWFSTSLHSGRCEDEHG